MMLLMMDRIAIHKVVNSDNYAVFDIIAPQVHISKKDEISLAVDKIKSRMSSTELIENMYKNNQGKLNTVYFILTNACNFSCDYCFAKNHISTGNMTRDVADFSIKKLKEYLVKFNEELVVTFYGGEPLINIDIAIYIMDELSAYKNVKFQLVTNGTLFTELIVKKLREYPIQIGVSIDGMKELHDSHRKYVGGENTYLDVIKAINLLVGYDYKITLSITLTEEIISNDQPFMDWLVDMPIENVTFNLLRCVFESFEHAKQYYEKAAEFMFKLYQSTKIHKLYEYNIFKRLKCLYDGTIFFAECAASSGNQITIDAFGNVYTCQIYREKNSLLGHISSFDICNTPSISKGKSIPIFCDFCAGCYAMPVCGGGCPIQAEGLSSGKESKDIGIDYSICAFSKKLMDLALSKINDLVML